ncbi:hypothetical protein AB0N73_10375 [Microbacterium sp. NPDC089189]|uniref:hypothetical protein n=1 Tax=Microbacterium sp. NPDC089189 TaxID=3154972 RepID=UPI003446891C
MSTAARSATTGTTFLRSWPSAAAWGAGLIQAALGAGAVIAADSTRAARGVGLVLVLAGLGLLVWGAVVLTRGALVALRAALALSLGSVLLVTALLVLAPARTSVNAAAVGIGLLVVVGATVATVLRRRRRTAASGEARDPGAIGILGLLVAAALVAVLVTPALASIQDAVLLREDGTLPVVDHGH